MKRFVIAAAVAVAIGFGTAGTADAQIVYGYNRPVGGGVATGATVMSPGVYQTYNSYYNPYSGVMQRQVYGSNWLGQTYGRSYSYNPWTGMSTNYGFYQPNYFATPYSYGFFRRW